MVPHPAENTSRQKKNNRKPEPHYFLSFKETVTVRSAHELRTLFPRLTPEYIESLEEHNIRFQYTYYEHGVKQSTPVMISRHPANTLYPLYPEVVEEMAVSCGRILRTFNPRAIAALKLKEQQSEDVVLVSDMRIRRNEAEEITASLVCPISGLPITTRAACLEACLSDHWNVPCDLEMLRWYAKKIYPLRCPVCNRVQYIQDAKIVVIPWFDVMIRHNLEILEPVYEQQELYGESEISVSEYAKTSREIWRRITIDDSTCWLPFPTEE